MSTAVTLLCCLRRADPADVEATIAAAAELLPDDCAYDVLLVGHGEPDRLADGVRTLLRRHPHWQALLHTRALSAHAALAAARPLLRTPWYVRPGVDAIGDRRGWQRADGSSPAPRRGWRERLRALTAALAPRP